MVGLWSLRFASDSSILVEVTDKVDAATAVSWVHAAFHCLERLRVKCPSIQNLHPAYRSLLIEFDTDRFSAHVLDPEILLARVHEALAALKEGDLPSVQLPGKHSQPASGISMQASSGRLIEVPVMYGGRCGPDLEDVARLTGLSIDEVIRRHSSVVYDVAFLGFSPGFPYLLGLPQELSCPRKAEPRVRVPAGSVAIGGSQTGIYPEDTPGGWRIIGRAQVRLFDPAQTPPTLLAPGDRLRFVPASRELS